MRETEIITPTMFCNIITRGLPKTGQIISYASYDDGTYEAGWWQGRLNANNRTRWIAKTIAGDDIVVDRATGLMWAADGNAAGCFNGGIAPWISAISYSRMLIFAGFDDWRLPNIKELESIAAYNLSYPAIEQPPFANIHGASSTDRYWSSTTAVFLTVNAFFYRFDVGQLATRAKTEENYLISVRGGL